MNTDTVDKIVGVIFLLDVAFLVVLCLGFLAVVARFAFGRRSE